MRRLPKIGPIATSCVTGTGGYEGMVTTGTVQTTKEPRGGKQGT